MSDDEQAVSRTTERPSRPYQNERRPELTLPSVLLSKKALLIE